MEAQHTARRTDSRPQRVVENPLRVSKLRAVAVLLWTAAMCAGCSPLLGDRNIWRNDSGAPGGQVDHPFIKPEGEAPRQATERKTEPASARKADSASDEVVRGQTPDGTVNGTGAGQGPYFDDYGGGRQLQPSNPSAYGAQPQYGQGQIYQPRTNAPYTATPPQGFAAPPETVVTPPPGGSFMQAPPLGYPQDGQILGVPGQQPVLQPPDRFVDVITTVEETQTGRFMFGVGVNSDAGVVGSIVMDEQNFDWRRIPSSWEDFRNGTAFRGAGQRLRIEAAPGTEVQRYLFDFKNPYLWDSAVSFGVSGFFYDRRFRDWDEERLGGRLSLGYQFTPDLSASAALRIENIDISRPRIPTPPELAEVLGDTQLYSLRTQIAHDTRDNTFLATEGHYVELGFEQAFGDFTFPRGTLDARRFFTLTERPDGSGRQVLSLTGRLGVSGNDTPLYEHFFAGGFSTMRGFEFRGASPVNQNVIVGGEFQLLGSVEYMFPITADDMLRGVTFVDFGTVAETVRLDSDTFRVAPGVGLRITIPALGPAPIALDFAFPVSQAPFDDTQVFSFFVGFGR